MSSASDRNQPPGAAPSGPKVGSGAVVVPSAFPLPPLMAVPSSNIFLVVLSLVAFVLNLGYGIVIPISGALAERCGGQGDETWVAMAVALMSFNLAKVLGEVPGGIFSDRIGDRRIVALSLLVYGLSAIMLIHARNPVAFAVARFIEGLSTGLSYPAMTSVLLKHSPKNRLGRNFSIALGAGVLGIVLGPVVAGPLSKWDLLSFTKDAIDRPLYVALFLTIATFALTVGWAWKAAEGHEAPPADKPREGFVEGVAREYKVLVRFMRNPTFLALIAPLFFDKLIMSAFQVLLIAHTPALGLEPVQWTGRLMAILALAFVIVTPISGPLSDRFSPRLLTHGSLVGIVATLAIMIFTWNPWAFIPVFFVYCMCSAMLLTTHLKMVGDIYHEAEGHGRIFGLVHAVSDLGMVLGPMLVWIYATTGQHGPVGTFVLMAVLGAFTIPAFIFSKGRESVLPRP